MNEETVIDVEAKEVVAEEVKPEVVPEETKKETTPEEAVQILKADQEKKVLACVKEVNEVLEKHGFDLVTAPVEIKVVPKQPKAQ